MSENNILMKNTIIYSIGDVFPKFLNFLILPIFTSYVSAKEFGIISYTNTLVAFISVLSTLSLNTYLLRKIFDLKNQEEKKTLIFSSFATITFVNIILLFVIYLFGPFLFEKYNVKVPFFPFIHLILLINFFEIFSAIPFVLLRVNKKAKTYVFINVLKSIFTFGSTCLLLIYFNKGILGYFYARLIINVIFSIFFIYYIFKNSILKFNFSIIKEGFRFSLPLVPGTISYLIITVFDRIVIEKYLDLTKLGVYSLLQAIALAMSIIIQGAYKAYEPDVFDKFGTNEFSTFVDKLNIKLLYFLIILSFPLSVFIKEILLFIAKPDYLVGFYLMPFFLTTILITSQNSMLNTLAIAEKKTTISSYSIFIGAILSIGINILFIPYFGIIVPAISSILAYMVMNLFLYSSLSTKLIFFKLCYFEIFLFLVVSYFCLNEISSIYFRFILVFLYSGIYINKFFKSFYT